MIKIKEDLTGQVFGKLTVLYQTEDHINSKGRHRSQWMCRCSCKNQTMVEVLGVNLKRGNTKSCGCLVGESHIKHNKYDLSGEYGIGWTTNTNREFYFDLEDYDKIKDYNWYESETKPGYNVIETNLHGEHRRIKMWQLLGFSGYDHIDRNTLNNRKCNLRPATLYENARNRGLSKNNKSGITGVRWHKKRKKWVSNIGVNKKHIHLGEYINKDDAIRARLQAEIKYFGDFAPQKHLFEQYGITKQND